MSDVTERSMKKTVYAGYVLGGFQIGGEKNAFSGFNVLFYVFSAEM